ncbi:MAG: glycosyltransferase [Lactobacillaceae bacterium]|jgi:poly(glycerol-phosphate) alpha-glucosyltransferase|nr:glycosyltransferase [Lactobacillaceae bacterium]
MFYFTSENIFGLNSGTEFSQGKRTQLFNLNGVPAKYVARNYNNSFSQGLLHLNLTSDQAINMYDFFQDAVDYVGAPANVRYITAIDKSEDHIEALDPNTSVVKHHGRIVAKAHIMSGTIGMVHSIDYYDRFENMVATDMWDYRGFKSSTNFYHPDGQIGTQRFFSPTGATKLEIIHMDVNGQRFPTMWKVYDYQGQVFRFNSEDELFTFFMNEIMKQTPGTIINDRLNLIDPIARVVGSTGKWQALHGVHTADPTNPVRGKLLPAFEPLFGEYAKAFHGVLVATEEQRTDLTKRYPKQTFITVPDTFIDEDVLQREKVTLNKRTEHKIIYYSRLSAEKRPEHAIRVFNKVKQAIPDATLEFRGYGTDQDLRKDLETKIENAGLKEAVTFANYAIGEERNKALLDAQVLLQTSTGEAFGMSVLEGMSFGLPAVVYNVNYGARDVVKTNENGYLIEAGKFDAAADAIINMFNDVDLAQQLSDGAYATAKDYNAEKQWNAWQQTGVVDGSLVKSRGIGAKI